MRVCEEYWMLIRWLAQTIHPIDNDVDNKHFASTLKSFVADMCVCVNVIDDGIFIYRVNAEFRGEYEWMNVWSSKRMEQKKQRLFQIQSKMIICNLFNSIKVISIQHSNLHVRRVENCCDLTANCVFYFDDIFLHHHFDRPQYLYSTVESSSSICLWYVCLKIWQLIKLIIFFLLHKMAFNSMVNFNDVPKYEHSRHSSSALKCHVCIFASCRYFQ